MAKYLLGVTESYRVDNETEVEALLESAKQDNGYKLIKYSSQKKETKAKGEVIDEYYKVTLTKEFNSEKEPEVQIEVEYK